MSSLPNEISFDITIFLPNDDMTDLMLMSRNFNALVTPRLRKIDQEMATLNQSIESFMPSPAPAVTDHEWISQLNLKRFLPIGSVAKKRMKEAFENQRSFTYGLCLGDDLEDLKFPMLDKLKKIMSLERFDKRSFLRIFCALLATPKFRQEYNIQHSFTRCLFNFGTALKYYFQTFDDVSRICSFYNPKWSR